MPVGSQFWAWFARLRRPLRREEGATTAEYALLLALVVVFLIETLSRLGFALQDKLNLIIEQIKGV